MEDTAGTRRTILGRNSVKTHWPQPGRIVGRRQEFERLNGLLRQATQGDRQVIFITGETGIGKTALIDMFCRQRCSEDQIYIARGQVWKVSPARKPIIRSWKPWDSSVRTNEGRRMCT